MKNTGRVDGCSFVAAFNFLRPRVPAAFVLLSGKGTFRELFVESQPLVAEGESGCQSSDAGCGPPPLRSGETRHFFGNLTKKLKIRLRIRSYVFDICKIKD